MGPIHVFASASEAAHGHEASLDCFVACAPRNDGNMGLAAAAADHGAHGFVGAEIFRAIDIKQRREF